MGGNTSISNASYFSKSDAEGDVSLFKGKEKEEKNYRLVAKKKKRLGFSSVSHIHDVDDDIAMFENVRLKERKEGGETIDCAICMEDEGKFIQLKCGHFFHRDCLLEWMSGIPKNGDEFLSNRARCPLCRAWIHCDSDKKLNKQLVNVKKKWKNMIKILIDSDIDEKHKQILKDRKTNKDSFFDFVKDYQFFLCYHCGKNYFGGMKACQANDHHEDDEEEVEENRIQREEEIKRGHVCVTCKSERMKKNWPTKCPKHGDSFIVFKCRYCCNIANWFCFGTTHFCERCHSQYPNMKVHPCKGLPECDGLHVENGEGEEAEQCLGCALCRNQKKKQ